MSSVTRQRDRQIFQDFGLGSGILCCEGREFGGPRGIHAIVADQINGINEDGKGRVPLAVEQSDHYPGETDVSNKNLSSDFETLKLDRYRLLGLGCKGLIIRTNE